MHYSSKEECAVALLYLFVLCPYVLMLIRAILVRLGMGFATDFLVSSIWIITIFVALKYIKSKLKILDILLIICWVGLYFWTGIKHPERRELLKLSQDVFLYSSVPLYFLGLAFNYKRHQNILFWTSVISLITYIFFVYAFSSGLSQGQLKEDNNLALAYAILPSVLLLVLFCLEEYSLFKLVLSIVGVFLLLTLGSRGPVVCCILFFAVYLLFFREYRYNVLGKTIILVVSAIVYCFVDVICLVLSNISSMIGMSSRVFDSVLNNSFANFHNSNARDEIIGTLIPYIKSDATGWGYGLMADRFFTKYGEYSHNLFVEVLISFGRVGGVIVLMILFFIILKSFIRMKIRGYRGILLVFFCSSIIQLMFSNSFITCNWLYLYLGFVVGALRIKVYEEL